MWTFSVTFVYCKSHGFKPINQHVFFSNFPMFFKSFFKDLLFSCHVQKLHGFKTPRQAHRSRCTDGCLASTLFVWKSNSWWLRNTKPIGSTISWSTEVRGKVSEGWVSEGAQESVRIEGVFVVLASEETKPLMFFVLFLQKKWVNPGFWPCWLIFYVVSHIAVISLLILWVVQLKRYGFTQWDLEAKPLQIERRDLAWGGWFGWYLDPGPGSNWTWRDPGEPYINGLTFQWVSLRPHVTPKSVESWSPTYNWILKPTDPSRLNFPLLRGATSRLMDP